MKIILIIVLFLLIGAFFIISNEKIKLTSLKEYNRFIKLYGIWFGNVVENTKQVTAQVIKMDWFPEK
jgi:hypothetical protein